MDKLYDAVLNISKETSYISGQLTGINDRLENVEKKVDKLSDNELNTVKSNNAFWRSKYFFIVTGIVISSGCAAAIAKIL